MEKNNYKPIKDWKRDSQILVVNSGSSSIKISLFESSGAQLSRLLDLHLKEIKNKPKIEIEYSEGQEEMILNETLNIFKGLQLIFKILKDKYNFSLTSLLGIGHRFVHGGNKYRSTIRFEPNQMIADFEKLVDLAPLHNESCLAGIKACLDFDKNCPQVIVFDTSFYQSLPTEASIYAIPQDITEKYQIKRYGFHGISHEFLWNTYKKHVEKKTPKIITIHLGNGCSATAILDGHPLDTSMGFSPSEGLVMGTRAGDIDSSVMDFLCVHGNKTPNEIMDLLNFQSGLLGLSGLSSEMNVLINLYDDNEKVRLAIDLFCYRIVKYIGAYLAVLENADALIFSGGIGENCFQIREKIIKKLEWLGIKLDTDKNKNSTSLEFGEIVQISSSDSKIPIYVIATDENLFIAKEVKKMLGEKS